MIGEQIGESKGKRIVRRVVSTDPATVEVTFEDSGHMGGVPTTGMGTYTSIVRPDGSIATDNAPDVLHVDVATLPLRQVARWTHLKPEVEAEAVNVLCDSVQDSWLEMRLAVSEKHTGEWRLFALRGLEVCGESLSEEV